MEAYWKAGVEGISLNEICRKSKVAKPSLYREFGNEDGLMKAVLLTYRQKMLTPMLQMLASEASFQEVLDQLISFATTTHDCSEIPKGCLIVKMRESRLHVGEATRKQIDRTKKEILTALESWVERAKKTGEFSSDISSRSAASYIDAQLNNALSQMSRGNENEEVKNILTMACSILK